MYVGIYHAMETCAWGFQDVVEICSKSIATNMCMGIPKNVVEFCIKSIATNMCMGIPKNVVEFCSKSIGNNTVFVKRSLSTNGAGGEI
jgi:hypothetical protein